ncbi:MAG TPA: alpha/beta fold hydrolase [Actinomycetota bacterium]|nr:alpha/beta fold hydrolase [Actinomycetota bacterium]
MERDLRETPAYREVEAFFRACLEPGFGAVTGLGTPEASPDGRLVAFPGEVLAGFEGHERSRICLAAADGSGWRTITAGPNDDVQPRWSPDGSTLTFLSDRLQEGRLQVYALDARTFGEARRLGDVAGVVEHHRWSPDGTRLLLVVAGEHAEQADALGSGTLGRGDAAAPGWLPDVESTDEADEWRRLWVLDAVTGEARCISAEGRNVWEASWLGDDAAAAIVSGAPGEGAWYGAELAVIDVVDGSERTALTSDIQLNFAEGSPDGRTVAVIEALCSDRYVAAGDLVLVDAGSGERRTVDAGPVDVSWTRWTDDGIFAIGLEGMDAVALHVDPSTGAAHELWRTGEGVGDYQPAGSPLPGGGFAVAVASARRPPAIVAVHDGAERELAATDHAGRAESIRHLGRSERISWDAPDGLRIDGLVRTPAGVGPFPLILLVHGGPVGAVTEGWLGTTQALLLSKGYAILMPNPRGSSGRGRHFAERVVGDMGGDDAKDLLAGVDAVVAAGVADPDRIGIYGGSYGGFMAAWLPAQDPRFRAAVSISPVTDWYSEHFNSSLIDWVGDFLRDVPEEPGGQHHLRSPVLMGETLRTPTLLTAGRNDRATPPGQAVEMFRALRARGIPAEVVVYPDEGHGVRDFPAVLDLTTRTLGWFERYLKPAGGAGTPVR